MKVRLVTDNVAVYSIMDLSSKPLIVLSSGSYITLGKSKKKNNTVWIEAKTSDRIVGYILDVECVLIKKVELLQNETKIYSEPSSESTIIGSIVKGEIFYIEDAIETENGEWVSMFKTTDKHGFINGDIIIKDISKDENSNSSMMNYFLYGGGFVGFLIAIIFSQLPYSSNSVDSVIGGGLYYGKAAALGTIVGGVIGWGVDSIRQKYF